MKLDPAERVQVEALKRGLEAAFGTRLREVRVFGSRARGTARSDSDLDVLVVLDRADTASRYRVFQEAHRVMLELDSYQLAPRVMGEAQFAALLAGERRLALDIQADGVTV